MTNIITIEVAGPASGAAQMLLNSITAATSTVESYYPDNAVTVTLTKETP